MTEQRLFSNQRLIRLIIPLVIEQALTILVGMCDGVMVSSVGEAAISGVSLVDMINNLIIVLFSALATGGAVGGGPFPDPGKASFWGRGRGRKPGRAPVSWC